MVSAPKDVAREEAEARPLIIGVTGHRDLVANEVPGIEARVRELFEDLAKRFPGRPLQVMSPLAEGADRIAALVAEDLGIELVVPLPMHEDQYSQDFESSRSWAEFGRLLRYASERVTLPLAPGSSEASIANHGPERNRQYAEAGAWIAARADILVAIWDGKMLDDLGGTGHVVKFRRDGEMPDYVPHASGLPARNTVFHIACSRNREDGQPADGLVPLQTRWMDADGDGHENFPPSWAELLNVPISEEDVESAAASEHRAATYGYRLPLVIGVTGHRDLKPEEIPGIQARVRELFEELGKRYTKRKLRVISPLAEGADRLVAKVALELGLELAVVMPMPQSIYKSEFTSAESIAEFDELYARAHEVFELPIARNGTIESISQPGRARDLQYAQGGVFLSAHCHILLALWDGKISGQLGGTGQVVRFHHDDIMPGYTTRTVATQQMLIDDESDLIYHIVCSRDGPDGAPAEGFEPLECWWFTNDSDEPRQRTLPLQHELIFARSAEFSEDAFSFRNRISSESYPLMNEEDADNLPAGLVTINHGFCISDWLAIHYQKLTLRILKVTHLLAFLMGFMFILFSDLRTQQIYMIAFLVFFAAAAGAQTLAKRKGWHRKYLDYRTLAEGLRVQFYLSAAGITSDNESKFTHDNFLQTQDPELGWIRNVMRVAGTRCDADRHASPGGLEFAIREWIGDNESGQLGYYNRKVAQWIKRNRNTERLSTLSLLTSVVVILLILFGNAFFVEDIVDPLFVLMGSMLLAYGVRQGYAQSTAEKELIKQYDFMLRVFYNSKRRLDSAEDDAERRQILQALGGSCLDEHAEWILMHRDRSIDQSDIWRLGS
ncbi:MAG: hypothetical protein GTO71_11555 [Woeseiaceae bacterium]|nr:hypothetical protein [Woeseiaceae bacterium]NIP21702.1 hypothetical protein [Woeseiaceae bacterium]NIS90788.1 hypothetical protein [Woeseiaceae bacterium]